MIGNIYVVGDIQGCYQELQLLLDHAQFDPQQDALWCVGDLVNRGPDSLGVLRFVKSLPHFLSVLGNHELYLLAYACGGKYDYRHTLEAILQAEDREELVDWIRTWPLIHYQAALNLVLFHAGIIPQWDLPTALNAAREVEAVLQGEDWKTFIHELYHSEVRVEHWDLNLTGFARLRFMTDVLTRLRFCTPEGELRMKNQGPAESRLPGEIPWFEQLHPDFLGRKLLFGHWAALEGNTHRDNVFALDTGCAWGKQLTLLKIPTYQKFQVDFIRS